MITLIYYALSALVVAGIAYVFWKMGKQYESHCMVMVLRLSFDNDELQEISRKLADGARKYKQKGHVDNV